MQKISFERHRFSSDLIVHAVWLYARFTLSLRDVEDLLAKRHWLWRAVDNEGTVLDFLVQSRRNIKAPKKLMKSLLKSLLKKQKITPTLIVTDKLRSYHAAFRELRITAQHNDDKRANAT